MKKSFIFVLISIFCSFFIFAEDGFNIEKFNTDVMKDFYFYADLAGLPKIEVDRFIKRKRGDYKGYSDFVAYGLKNDETYTIQTHMPSKLKDRSFEFYLVVLSLAMRNRYDWRIKNGGSEAGARQDVFEFFIKSFPRTDYAGEWTALLTSDWTDKFIGK